VSASTILPEITKRIAYNRTSKDYDCYISIDGDPEQYIGSADTHPAAETKCRDYAYNYYEDNNTPEKAVAVVLADEVPASPTTCTRQPADVPIALLSNGITVMGEFGGKNNTPGCVYIKTEDGQFFCDSTGHLAGEWSGVALEIEPDALPALRTLFTGTVLTALQDIARARDNDGDTPPIPECRHTPQIVVFAILAHLDRNRARYGLGRAAMHELGDFIAQTVDREMGCVEFERMGVLESVAERHERVLVAA
jgi:hypothetical protein